MSACGSPRHKIAVVGSIKQSSALSDQKPTYLKLRAICLPQVTSTDSNDAIMWASDRKLPCVVGADTPQVIKQLVAGLEFDIAACDTQFVVHTGGPAILKGTQDALGLPDDQMQVCMPHLVPAEVHMIQSA